MKLPALREILSLRTPSGRRLLALTALVAALALVDFTLGLPGPLAVIRTIVSLVWFGAAGLVGAVALLHGWRRAFRRVRRKLVLSYVFLGFVPLVLVLAFVTTGGALLYMSVAQYVYEDAVADLVRDVRELAEVLAHEPDTTADAFRATLERHRDLRMPALGEVSAILVRHDRAGEPLVAGPWAHEAPVSDLPAWLNDRFAGVLLAPASPREGLVIRATARTPDGRRTAVVDLPLQPGPVAALAERTGARLTNVLADACDERGVEVDQQRPLSTLFSQAVVFIDCVDWTSGLTHRLPVTLDAPLSVVSARLASGRATQVPAQTWWTVFVQLLLFLALLFFLIQAAAVVMGALLVRSITTAVHELGVGTDRIQRGDFTHRIPITSRDELGELAESFNRMSGSIEHLLHVQREKQRLDDELRIARDIQRSLLPVRPPKVKGLEIADYCEPAREVGGDYYDFFCIGPRTLGVIIADVSGKGTSAALYMAELKGLMLALSHAERSPRRLLVDVNRLLAEHLDNRSFITMTYAVLDLDERKVTLARAGHTPALVVTSRGAELAAPSGMVLGLRLPGAAERFEELLHDVSLPLGPGDVVVLYTDGITEAMSPDGDLFGDGRLLDAVADARTMDADAIRARVIASVREFAGDAEPHDDMTLVVLKIRDEVA